jgi:hypothetical protein
MPEARDFCDVYARAEPDDEYEDHKPEPLDPYLIDEDGETIEEEEELDEDEI